MLIQLKKPVWLREGIGDRISGRVWYRGSFTVEAVFLFPVIVLLLAFILHLSMDWYGSVQQAAADVDVLRELDSRSLFLDQSTLREILDILN